MKKPTSNYRFEEFRANINLNGRLQELQERMNRVDSKKYSPIKVTYSQRREFDHEEFQPRYQNNYSPVKAERPDESPNISRKSLSK